MARILLQSGRVSLRHIKRVSPGTPGAKTILGIGYLPQSLNGLNGLRGFQSGSFDDRLGEDASFSVTFSNSAGSDGKPHIDRFLIRVGNPDGTRYRPGDEWIEISRGRRLLFVGTPTDLIADEKQIVVSGVNALWLLKKTRELDSGFWPGAAPRDFFEFYSQVWQDAGSDTFDALGGVSAPVTLPDSAPPPPPGITQPANGSSMGDTTPTFIGSARDQEGDSDIVVVTLYHPDGTVADSENADRVGAVFFITHWPRPLASGTYNAKATQSNAAGTSLPSATTTFTVAAPAPLRPAPTIGTPTQGQSVTDATPTLGGQAGNAAGDATTVRVRVYTAPQNVAVPPVHVSAPIPISGGVGAPWTYEVPVTLANGNYYATVEQAGTSGVGVSAARNFSVAVPTAAGLAMPRGPVNGFAQAADFYDSVGVCHHPEYFFDSNPTAASLTTGIQRIQELGLRHVRLGLWSPASHGDANYEYKSQNFPIRERALRGSNQPISVLWGTPREPAMTRQAGNEVYTIDAIDGTFLRPLDGPSGSVSATLWPDGAKKYAAGVFYATSWLSAGGLQGPNEPDARPRLAQGVESVRAVESSLQTAKNARATVDVLNGTSYIDSSTGRITAGPAKAPQLPTVGFHLTAWPPALNDGVVTWNEFGDYSGATDVDVGCLHIYWGGHEPSFGSAWQLSGVPVGSTYNSMWFNAKGYNGAMFGVRYARKVEVFVTEQGYISRPGYDGFGGQRFVPSEIAGEYLIRCLIHNYLSGVCRRTFLFSLNDVSGTAFGLCDTAWTRRAAFYAIKNLMELVGWTQGITSAPITITSSGFTPGADNIHRRADNSIDCRSPDGLRELTLQREAAGGSVEYLHILVRDRMLWNRATQTPTTADLQNVVLQLPVGTTWTAAGAQPAKNPIKDPVDGGTYANPGNGTAYAALSVNGATNQLTVPMRGLTTVVKING